MLLIISLIPLSPLPFTSVLVAFIAPHQAFVAELSMMSNLVVWCQILFYSSMLRGGVSLEQVRQICLKLVSFLKREMYTGIGTGIGIPTKGSWVFCHPEGYTATSHLEGQEGPRTLQKNTKYKFKAPPVAPFHSKSDLPIT